MMPTPYERVSPGRPSKAQSLISQFAVGNPTPISLNSAQTSEDTHELDLPHASRSLTSRQGAGPQCPHFPWKMSDVHFASQTIRKFPEGLCDTERPAVWARGKCALWCWNRPWGSVVRCRRAENTQPNSFPSCCKCPLGTGSCRKAGSSSTP